MGIRRHIVCMCRWPAGVLFFYLVEEPREGVVGSVQGDEVAQEIIARAAVELSHSVKNAAVKAALYEDSSEPNSKKRQRVVKVVVSGGVLQSDSPVLEAVITRLGKLMPSAEVGWMHRGKTRVCGNNGGDNRDRLIPLFCHDLLPPLFFKIAF